MEPVQWLSICLVCLLGAASPGPSLVIVLRNAPPHRRMQGYVCALSHGVAVLIYALITVFGLTLLFNKPQIQALLIWASSLFLGWLGMQLLINKPRNILNSRNHPAPGNYGTAALQGFAVAFLNPKLAAFFLAVFSQFLQPELGTHQKLLMAAAAGSIDALWYSLVVTVITRAKMVKMLENNGFQIDRVFGLVLVALAISIIWR